VFFPGKPFQPSLCPQVLGNDIGQNLRQTLESELIKINEAILKQLRLANYKHLLIVIIVKRVTIFMVLPKTLQ
jgi:hypothetical protein